MTENEQIFWNRVLELAKSQLKQATYEFFVLDARLIQIEQNTATIYLDPMKELFWDKNLKPIILTAGFEVYNAEIVVNYVFEEDLANKQAVEEATFAAGAREVHLIEEPVAAAIGAGIDISKPCGNMIVDIGGGTADIAVISLGGTVVNTSIKVAGDDFDEAIVRYMRKKHNLLIGERTAEDIKIKIGTTYPLAEEEKMEVRGRNLVTGLPKTVTVTSSETEEALRECTGQIVEAVVSVLEQTPPELSADILDRGIVLTGGGSLLRGLEELIEEKTGINTMTAEDPMKVVAIGTGEFVEFMSGRKDY